MIVSSKPKNHIEFGTKMASKVRQHNFDLYIYTHEYGEITVKITNEQKNTKTERPMV